MGSPVNVPVPKTWTDLSLDQLKIMYSGRKSLSSRRLACVVDKYDLLKYLWKEAIIEDRTLEQYKVNNIDEISRHDDAFSRHLLGDDIFSGENEYGKFYNLFNHNVNVVICSSSNKDVHQVMDGRVSQFMVVNN